MNDRHAILTDHAARDAAIAVNSYTTSLRRPQVSHETYATYCRDVHGPLCSRVPGLARYVRYHLDREQDGHLWPEQEGIAPFLDYVLDGGVEIGFASAEDQRVRNDIRDVGRLAPFPRRRPDTAAAEDPGRFQVEQREAGVPVPTLNGIVAALRFFFCRSSPRSPFVEPQAVPADRRAASPSPSPTVVLARAIRPDRSIPIAHRSVPAGSFFGDSRTPPGARNSARLRSGRLSS